MKMMPYLLASLGGRPLPEIPIADFNRRISAIVGSELTAEEIVFRDRAVSHNWSLIVIANELRVRRGLAEWPAGVAIPE